MDEFRATECARTRQWISAALDRELSQFEEALLNRHVARCAACASFDARAAAVTSAIRNAPVQRTRRTLQLPARRRPAWRTHAPALRFGSAAAAVACLVSFGVLASPERGALRGGHILIAAPLEPSPGINELVVDVRRPALARGEHQALAYGADGIGVHKPPLAPTP